MNKTKMPKGLKKYYDFMNYLEKHEIKYIWVDIDKEQNGNVFAENVGAFIEVPVFIEKENKK